MFVSVNKPYQVNLSCRKALIECVLLRVNIRLVGHTSRKPQANVTIQKVLLAACGVRQGAVGHSLLGRYIPHTNSALHLA